MLLHTLRDIRKKLWTFEILSTISSKFESEQEIKKKLHLTYDAEYDQGTSNIVVFSLYIVLYQCH